MGRGLGGNAATRIRWGGLALVTLVALAVGGAAGTEARQLLDARLHAQPLPGVTAVRAQPLPDSGQGTVVAAPSVLPDHILLQVPFTTQAPLGNWAQHQESCEAANLTQLWFYWNHSSAIVIDPRTADGYIHMIDGWKPQQDLDDAMLGEMAQERWGYTYTVIPDNPTSIAEQLSAGRPLLAEVRTHGLGNGHYPGYYSHYEQTGWSVPHFVTIIGYDATGVWLNDPGISWGRGYHITYAQLTHAIADLNQHHPALANGDVLLLIAPEAQPKIKPGML